jgi:hypothetical protein
MEARRAERPLRELPEAASSETTARNLRTVLALAALFVLPVAGSFWLYYGASWRPAGHVNHGELIQPVRPLPDVPLPIAGSAAGSSSGAVAADAGAPPNGAAPEAGGEAASGSGRPLATNVFRKRWVLVYVGDGQCDRTCQYALYVMRQTWLALNADAPRVERVFLATGGCCGPAPLSRGQGGLLVLDASASSGRRLLAQFPREDRNEMIFLVDPLGNLMMRYDSRRDPKGLLQDLRRLLQLSHSG